MLEKKTFEYINYLEFRNEILKRTQNLSFYSTSIADLIDSMFLPDSCCNDIYFSLYLEGVKENIEWYIDEEEGYMNFTAEQMLIIFNEIVFPLLTELGFENFVGFKLSW